jgi:hypothetical protein
MKLLWRAESFSAGNPLQPFTGRNTLIKQAQRLLPAIDVHPRSVNPFVEGYALTPQLILKFLSAS